MPPPIVRVPKHIARGGFRDWPVAGAGQHQLVPRWNNTTQQHEYVAVELAGAAAAAVATHAALTSGVHSISAFGATLVDDAAASNARTTLELGTAATLNVGTAANNVVQLDGSARLPAVDGSQLTNLPGGGGGTPGGSDTQVQFNDGGAFGGDAGLVYNKTTDVLTLAGRLITPKWSPASDSTTALQVTRADGTTVVSRWNTTNGRFVTAPIQLIDTFLGSATGEFIWYDSSGGAGIRIQSTGDIYLRPYDGAAVFQFSSGNLNINNPSGSAQVNVKATGGVDNYAAVRGHNSNTASGFTQYCLYALVDPIGGASNIAGYFKAINSTANYAIYTDGGDCRLGASNSDKIGFHGVAPVARQLLATGAGATVDDVITALQNLGLLRQS